MRLRASLNPAAVLTQSVPLDYVAPKSIPLASIVVLGSCIVVKHGHARFSIPRRVSRILGVTLVTQCSGHGRYADPTVAPVKIYRAALRLLGAF
jgi:hypothetical protein